MASDRNAERTVQDLMRIPDNVVVMGESVRNTLPQFKLETTRALIVVSDKGPAGVITRNRAQNLSDAELDRAVEEFVIDTPVLTPDMPLDSARQLVEGTDFEIDRVPVADQNGALLGVVDRASLVHEGSRARTNQGTMTISRADTSATAELASGMTVYGSDEEKLGELDEILVENGVVSALIVKHGFLGRHHKRIAADHVSRADSNGVYLDFGKQEFKYLADMEQQEAEAL